MMEDQHLEIPIPERTREVPVNMEKLREMLSAMLELHVEMDDTCKQVIENLLNDGWEIDVAPAWIAKARRGRFSEQCSAQSPNEAMHKLFEQIKYETGYGCP